MNKKDKEKLTQEIHDAAEEFAKSTGLGTKIAGIIAKSLEEAIIIGVTETLVGLTEQGIAQINGSEN